MPGESTYASNELPLFAAALNWKRYFSRRLAPYLGPNVLEVGAGLGATTRAMRAEHPGRWTCLEPDPAMVASLEAAAAAGEFGNNCEVKQGTVADLSADCRYDSLIYIDVLEHIERDAEELLRASGHLNQNGTIVVLSPAFNFLFSEFDAAVGHFRRYNIQSLRALTPPGTILQAAFYLDSAGLFASLANRLFLRKSMPTPSQILLWDTKLVPISQILDGVFNHFAGRSVVGVWRKT